MADDNVKISERDLIIGSAICFIGLAVFYGCYLLGREIGSLLL